MKNPNGYGYVYKLSGRRRRPYAARVTRGWTDDGKQIKEIIGYYETRSQALVALAEYNKDPLAFSCRASVREVYAGWHADKFYGDYSLEQERNYAKAFGHMTEWYDRQFNTIKLQDMQALCDSLPSYEQAYRVKALLRQMSEWAILREQASVDYAAGIQIKQLRAQKKARSAFTRDEIETIAADNSRVASIITVLIYTGCRVSELLDLRRDDVHMDQRYIYIRDAKTKNGIRVIPLHDRILPIVETMYAEGHDYLVTTTTGIHFTYSNWHNSFTEYMQAHNMQHLTHETRHTFISLLAMAHIDQVYIKKLCGHTSAQSLTERVYTHIDIEDLRRELNKI